MHPIKSLLDDNEEESHRHTRSVETYLAMSPICIEHLRCYRTAMFLKKYKILRLDSVDIWSIDACTLVVLRIV